MSLFSSVAFLSYVEPINVKEAIEIDSWVSAMQEELNQFERNEVWELVPRLSNRSIIGTKWVFTDKMDEDGNVVRNKARLVAQGYNQEEGILAYASHRNFKLYQMDECLKWIHYGRSLY